MAGTAVSRGVPRQITQGTIPAIGANEIPRIQFSSGAARALEAFSRDMFSLADGFQDQMDAQAEAEATTEGALEGAAGPPTLRDYGTIRGRAFNKAAVETFVTTMETNSIFKVQELSDKHAADPAGLQQALEDYATGVSREVEKVYAPAGAVFKQRLALRSAPAVEAAKDARYKLTRDQADAAIIQNEVAVKAEIKSIAGDLFSENPARSNAAAQAVGALQNEYLRIYDATDPTTGRPLYSAEEKAKAKVGFYEDVMESAAIGWFEQQPDKAGAYTKFTEGEFTINLDTPGADPSKVVVEKQSGLAAVRKRPVQPDVRDKLAIAAAATDPGVTVVVTSGGQPTIQEARALRAQGVSGRLRTGSTRHDEGNAADVVLMRNGQKILPGEDPELYAKFLENAAAAGFTGIGHYSWGVHVGGGSPAAWGPSTGAETLDPRFAAAINRGRQGPRLDTRPQIQSVDIRKALPEEAMARIESEMRSRITFRNTLADRQIAAEEKQLKRMQDAADFEYTNRVFGGIDPETNEPVAPLTREEVTEAVRSERLSPTAGKAIIRAMTVEKPDKSNPSTYRDALARLYAGENIYNFVLDNADKLSGEDASELLGKNQTLNIAGEGGMSKEQQFHFDNLKDLLTPDSLMAKVDDGAEDRKYLALDEYRRRTDAGEPPRDVASDLRDRAKLTFETLTASKLDTMVRPRFAVTVPGTGRLDLGASGKALLQAQKDGKIDAAEFEKQKQALREWATIQNALDQQGAKPK